MEEIKVDDAVTILTSVAAYGGQLAAVFHNYSLISETIPDGFEGAINILDATVATLKQILIPLSDEAGAFGKKLFSEEGLKYARLLGEQCATTLSEVERAIEEACLGRQERKALVKRKKEASYIKFIVVPDPLSLKLDEEVFLEKVEKMKWSWAIKGIEKCMERLYELQLHILLVYQVITVCALSKDVSSGKVDIKSIVTYHERINRTADLIGIKSPPRRTANYGRRNHFSSTDSFDSDTDSDASSKISNMRRCKRAAPSPPPPPGNWPSGPSRSIGRNSLPQTPPNRGTNNEALDALYLEAMSQKEPVVACEIPNPPAYSESNKSAVKGESSSSTPLGTVTPPSSVMSSLSNAEKSNLELVDPDGKTPVLEEELADAKEDVEPTTPEARLFKSKSTGIGFKFKRFFRNKSSLAEEMRQALSDTESTLTAFVIQRNLARRVPHSAFHSLEATHLKTVLSQLNDNSWYKTFSTLDFSEQITLGRLLQPWVYGKPHTRELVVLKVVEQNRLNAWMVLLSELLRNQAFPRGGTGRVILAIFREQLVDGKPLPSFAIHGGHLPPPGPLPGPPPPPASRNIKHPPLPYNTGRLTKIFDLNAPPPPPSPPGGWGSPCMPGPPPHLSSASKKSSVRVINTTPITESDAKEILTTYNEYTVRICEPSSPNELRSWQRVVVTQESAERNIVKQRVEQFEARDGNTIETKLRMAQQQSEQVSRIMDEIKSSERDSRFEWCWAEISLHDHNGKIIDLEYKGPPPAIRIAAAASIIHLIAMRSPRLQYMALDIYNALMKLGPSPSLGGRPGGPSPIFSPPTPSPIIKLAPKPKKPNRSIFHINDSDSDARFWSSDSSVGNVRRRLRKYKAKKVKTLARKRYYDSDSDSDADEEEKDIIEVPVELQKGDDVVKKLLDLWTAQPEEQGKGRGG